jgi:ATP adenylyltransferase
MAHQMRNEFSHLTAKERESISFPSKWLMERGLLKGNVLDFGCGLGKDVEVLKGLRIDITGYDPYYFPEYPKGGYDTIICNYVLNVIDKREQFEAIVKISKLLRSNGHCYFTVRRDIKKSGFRIHQVHKKPTFQTNVKLPFPSLFLNRNCEIYDFQRIVDKPRKDTCIFCTPNNANFISESALSFAIYDKYPVNEGHALVIPKRHVHNFFELSENERIGLWMLAEDVKIDLQHRFNALDFNIGFNIGKSAGQTIAHCHLHIIPRFPNDVENPIGGIRNVIPGKGVYIDLPEF